MAIIKRGRPLGSKNINIRRSLMITLETSPELWQTLLHWTGCHFTKTDYINGIPQKTQRLKIIEARELLAKASIDLEFFFRRFARKLD